MQVLALATQQQTFSMKINQPTTGGGGGGGGPVTGLTGTPTQFVYIDNAGNGTGDALATRDSSTLETTIGALFTGDFAGAISIDPATENVNFGTQDFATGEAALYQSYVNAGSLHLQFGYSNPTLNVGSTFLMESTGNKLIYQSDTTNDLVAVFDQNENIFGAGTPGNAVYWEDTVTGEKAGLYTGDLSAVGGSPFAAALNYSLGNISSLIVADSVGASMLYDDIGTLVTAVVSTDATAVVGRWTDGTISAFTRVNATDAFIGYDNGVGASSGLTLTDTGATLAFVGATTTSLKVEDGVVTSSGDFLVEATVGGNQWFNIAPASGLVQLGDLSGGGAILEVNNAGTGSINVTKPIKLQGYTQATLPTGVVGQTAYITDALTPTFGATAVGGGAVTIPVFYDGTTWIVG